MDNTNIHDVLYKYQFRLKLGLKTLLLSQASFLMGIFCYFCFDGINAIFSYSIGMLVYYKFFYSLTKDGYQYDVLVFRVLARLNNIIRQKRKAPQ